MNRPALISALTAIAWMPCLSPAQAADPGSHIRSVTAITEVFGEGPRVTGAAIEYDKSIANAALAGSEFTVKDRTITKVYANNSAAKTQHGHDGNFVILELSPADATASLSPRSGMGGGPRPGGAGPGGAGPGGGPGGPPPGGGAAGGPPRNMSSPAPLAAKVSVEQVAPVKTASGQQYPALHEAVASNKTVNLVVDDFVQRVFKDPKSGDTLRYNLFVPKNYDKSKSYPMVLFMPDATLTGAATERTLTQGTGAVIWATPEEQAKHPSFVVAPTFDSQEASDDFKTNGNLETTVDLVDAIAGEYSVDKSRLYTTGQSGGCMLSIAIMIKHPDLFAAAMLVAGQWDPQTMTTLVNKNMWITVSEGDFKAFPGMNESLAAMEKAGAKVARGRWSARISPAETKADDEKMLSQGTHILYTVYDKGTTFPAGQETGGTEHMQTWKVAYYNEGIRDWLFKQKK